MNERIALLIPALNPEDKLLDVIDNVKNEGFTGPIVLVDDGSREEVKNTVFKAAEDKGAIVIHHARNLGKGRALKDGFNDVLVRFPDCIGVITADADGQHLAQDIVKCADILDKNPNDLILGCRDFDKSNVPGKSVAGNKFTRLSMRFLCGVNVKDTQTGLRGIPREFMMHLLDIPGERFDYETNMLLETRIEKTNITQYDIETVYFEQNRKSNYRPLIDSVRIFMIFLKFCMSSLIGCIVDIALFTVFNILLKMSGMDIRISIPTATFLARVISAFTNYMLNKKVVFKTKNEKSNSAVKYAILCILQLSLSAGLVLILKTSFGGVETLWKILVDVCLFFASFQIQRRFIF